jgi:type IV secretory pathway VirB2 component (pilin)
MPFQDGSALAWRWNFTLDFMEGAGGGGIAYSLCKIVYWFTEDGIGKAIASLAVIFLGIQAFFGKVQWGTALMFVAGIFAIFGSQEIVDAVTGGMSSGGC